MIVFHDTRLTKLALHHIGNKSNEEGMRFSKSNMKLDEQLISILQAYFLSPFKHDEYFNLYHESDLNLNEVYSYVTSMFEDPESFHEQSVNLAKHLYENSVHPKIKSGEFYTVYFKDCVMDGETVDAIGLFKSENKDTFLKVYQAGDNFAMDCDHGININKLDKGCLILNTERDKGYLVAIVDNTNKSTEAQYWLDDFLHVMQRKDEYFNTQTILNVCKTFVTKELPQQFAVSKADQADFLNKSVKFFKEKETFDMDEFTQEVMVQPEVIESFRKYKTEYQSDWDVDIADSFAISDTAVKKQARVFKSIIKLDKNFHIYVHGNRNLIEQGIDENGRKYYKIYYQQEL